MVATKRWGASVPLLFRKEKMIEQTLEEKITQINNVTTEFNLDQINKVNFLRRVQPLINKGWIIDRESGKLTPVVSHLVGDSPFSTDTPWIFARKDDSTNCALWSDVVFHQLGFIHKGCLSCYKVVVRPNTVKQLFQLMRYQELIYDKPCKCGIEKRPYVHGLYGGYFYNRSLEEGRGTYKRVRSDIDKYISPGISVILKRACTEFEMRFKDSTTWDGIRVKNLEKHERWEFIAEANTDIGMNKGEQPGSIKIDKTEEWIQFAYEHGDKTALEFNDGKPLYTPCRTYHDNDIQIPIKNGGDNGDAPV